MGDGVALEVQDKQTELARPSCDVCICSVYNSVRNHPVPVTTPSDTIHQTWVVLTPHCAGALVAADAALDSSRRLAPLIHLISLRRRSRYVTCLR